MKKLIIALIIFSIIVGLSGCKSGVKEETLEEIISNSIEAFNNIKSFNISMDINQTSTPDKGEAVKMDMMIEMDTVTDPISIYQQLELENFPYNMEMYLTDDGMFFKDSTTNLWVKASNETYLTTIETSKQQNDASLMIEQLKEYIDIFTIEEKDDHYVLSFSASGEKYKDLIIDSIKTSLPEGISLDEVLEKMTINTISYTFTIEKETYYPRDFNIDIDLVLDVEGNKIHTIQKTHGTYSKFNEIKNISVPNDVKEQAIEIDF